MKSHKLFRHIIRTGLTALSAFAFLWQGAFLAIPQAIAASIEPDAGLAESGLVIEAVEPPSLSPKELTQAAQADNQADAIADSVEAEVGQAKTPPAVIENSEEEEIAEATDAQKPPQLPTESSEKSEGASDNLTETGEGELDAEAGESAKGDRELADDIKPAAPIEEKPSPRIEDAAKQVIAEAQTGIKEPVSEPSPIFEDSLEETSELAPGNDSSTLEKEELGDAALDDHKLAEESKSPVKEKSSSSSEDLAKPVIADLQADDKLNSEPLPISKDRPEETADISTELDSSNQVKVEVTEPEQDKSELADDTAALTEDAPAPSAEASARAELLTKIKVELKALVSNAVKVTLDLFKLGFDLLSTWISQLLQNKG